MLLAIMDIFLDLAHERLPPRSQCTASIVPSEIAPQIARNEFSEPSSTPNCFDTLGDYHVPTGPWMLTGYPGMSLVKMFWDFVRSDFIILRNFSKEMAP